MNQPLISKQSMGEKVLVTLRHQILLGEIEQDTHLKENELSEKFGVSRGPIREAIAQLEKEGLVYTPRNGRTRVIGFSDHDIDNLYQVRFALEALAISQIALPLPANVKEEVQQVIQLMEEPDGSESTMEEADFSFHYYLVAIPKNKTLIQLWLSISGLVKSLMKITNSHTRDRRREVISHHQKILDFLASGERQAAQEALRTHLLSATDSMKHAMAIAKSKKSQAGYFA